MASFTYKEALPMISTLLSPRVSHALEYDTACKKCFEEFNTTHQLMLEKMQQLIEGYEQSDSKMFHDIVVQALILSERAKSLANIIKDYIHENGVLTPRRSISPRPQSLLPNLHMLRRIKLAQNLQLKIYKNLENIQSQAVSTPNPASQTIKLRKFTIKEYLVIKNIEFALLNLTIKISDFTRNYFPKFTLKMEDLLREAELAPQKSKQPVKLKQVDSPEEKKPGQDSSLRLDLSRIRDTPTPSPVLETNPEIRLRSSFMSRTMEMRESPSLKSQAGKLNFACAENNIKLIRLIDGLKSEKKKKVLSALFGGHKNALNTIKNLYFFIDKVNGRTNNFWFTLNKVKPLQKELLQNGIKGLKLCEELQIRFISSLEEVLEQISSMTVKEALKKKLPFQRLSEEFEEEILKLNQQTFPSLFEMSAVIKEAFGDKIAIKVKRLLEKVESHPPVAQLLVDSDEQLFQAEIDLEENLEKYRLPAGHEIPSDFLPYCYVLIGAYQSHEIVQEQVLKQLNAMLANLTP